MAKQTPQFNTNAQQLLVILSLVSLFISSIGPMMAAAPAGPGLNLGPVFMSLIAIPLGVAIGAMGLALTIKTDRSKKQPQVSKVAGWLIFFYLIVILMPIALLYVTASA